VISQVDIPGSPPEGRYVRYIGIFILRQAVARAFTRERMKIDTNELRSI
jgi:hypothetical protein